MKGDVLCVGDLHFGEKGDSEKLNNQLLDFLIWVTELAKEREIETCVQFGDWFHQRNKINVSTLSYGRQGAKILGDYFGKDHVYVLEGNHDLYYLDRLDVSSVNSLDQYVTVIDKPTTVGTTLMVPWITDNEMWDKVIGLGETHDYLYSHLELNGFTVNDRYTMEHGYSPKELRRFRRVVTGHYHTQQQKDNIHYLGSALALTMNEANEPHGVFIHNTESDTFEFVEYDRVKVISISYKDIDKIKDFDPKNTTVRIEFPDDLEDETLITDIQKQLEEMEFSDNKIKYKGQKAKALLEQHADVQEVENIDEFVVVSIREMNEVSGVDRGLLEELYSQAKEREVTSNVGEAQ